MANEANTIWIKGFSPDGFQVSVTLAITDATEITSVLDQVRAQGIRPTPPPAQPVTDRMTITTVARRMWTGKDGKQKHAVDLYPDWAQFRVFTIYLDTDEDVKAFESASGKQISTFPVINSRSAVEKIAGDPNLVNCDPEFDVLYNKEVREDGKIRDVFVGYANEVPAPAPSPKVTPIPAPKRAKDNPSALADDTTPKHPYTTKPKNWTEDRAEADAFNKQCRLYGMTPINVLRNLEPGKQLVSFREITLTKEQAYARLKELAERPAQPQSTADMIDEVIADRDNSQDQATADNPLGGTVPEGFKTQDRISDVPF